MLPFIPEFLCRSSWLIYTCNWNTYSQNLETWLVLEQQWVLTCSSSMNRCSWLHCYCNRSGERLREFHTVSELKAVALSLSCWCWQCCAAYVMESLPAHSAGQSVLHEAAAAPNWERPGRRAFLVGSCAELLCCPAAGCIWSSSVQCHFKKAFSFLRGSLCLLTAGS